MTNTDTLVEFISKQISELALQNVFFHNPNCENELQPKIKQNLNNTKKNNRRNIYYNIVREFISINYISNSSN